jgi:hypothetical protein
VIGPAVGTAEWHTELGEWARKVAASLPPFTAEQIGAVARIGLAVDEQRTAMPAALQRAA